ncbi:MAG TPA: hypothetical protein VMU38_10085 [Candidatus Binatia bacterium]|nr:hypothetical protein [Candidatus Binatia bacterium]
MAILAFTMPAGAGAKNYSNLGVAIQSCVVNSKDGKTNGINVVFLSAHVTTVKEVDFLVVYNGRHYTLTDKGTFSRGAPINHNLTNALVGETWRGPLADVCAVKRVLLENGKIETT